MGERGEGERRGRGVGGEGVAILYANYEFYIFKIKIIIFLLAVTYHQDIL